VPFLSDSPAQLDAAVRQIAETGAGHVTPIVLHLRPGTREWFFTWLHARHPELVGPYQELYGRGAYAPKAYQNRIAGQVRELAAKHGIGRPRPGFGRGTLPRGSMRAASPADPPAPRILPAPRPPQTQRSPWPALPPAQSGPAQSGPAQSGPAQDQRRSTAVPEQLTLL